MSKLSVFSRQEISKKTSKLATEALWSQEDGGKAYTLAGKILICCGGVWLIISIIPIMCNESINKCLWMWVVAFVQIIAGTLLVIFSKKSQAFQKWANKDFAKDKCKYQK